MAMLRSIAVCNFRHLSFISHYRSVAFVPNPSRILDSSTSASKHRFYLWSERRTPWSAIIRGAHSQQGAPMEKKVEAATPHVSRPFFPSWARWLLGSFLSLFLPFWSNKWEKLLQIEDEVEKVTDAFENTAEVVEKVAEVTQMIASEVAEKLPDGGKLKGAVLLIEDVSKEVAKDAKLTLEIIHQVDDLKEEVDTLLEPIVDQEPHVEEEARV